MDIKKHSTCRNVPGERRVVCVIANERLQRKRKTDSTPYFLPRSSRLRLIALG